MEFDQLEKLIILNALENYKKNWIAEENHKEINALYNRVLTEMESK